jgi:NAD kinase
MRLQSQPSIAVVTRETRLDQLRGRWATSAAASFRLQASVKQEVERRRQKLSSSSLNSDLALQELEENVESFSDQQEVERAGEQHRLAREHLMHEIDVGYPLLSLDQRYLANFDFGRCVAIVVLGPDGLVANTAKYAGDVPIIGVNSDPASNDGILVPHRVADARAVLQRTLKQIAETRSVTLAEVTTNDGQRLLAFNDFFVGRSGHVSARYAIEVAGGHERQSSSGVLIATGVGSTGWLSSMFNMVNGFNRVLACGEVKTPSLSWTDRRLMWAVREPFVSRHSEAGHVFGWVDDGDELVIASHMPQGGVIFSDGLESDFLEFTTGTIARFQVAEQVANLVI